MLNDRELVHEDVVNHIQSCYMSRVYCGQQRVIKIVVVSIKQQHDSTINKLLLQRHKSFPNQVGSGI